MILKGIIESIIDTYTVKVRIPLLHRIPSSAQYVELNDLPEASICTLPNTYLNLQIGNVVLVAFENDDKNKPVVIGHLFTNTPNSTSCSPQFSSLTVENDTVLSANTTIGEVSSFELAQLQGVDGNIQKQLDSITDTLENFKKIDESVVIDSLDILSTDLSEVTVVSKSTKNKVKNIESYLGDLYVQGTTLKNDLHSMFPTKDEFNKLSNQVEELIKLLKTS